MIVIIDNYDSFTYNLYQMIAMQHDHVRVIRNDKITVSNLFAKKISGIILSPGPGRPEKAGMCIPIIKALLARKYEVPLLGVCLGHQAIVAAMAGQIVPAKEIVHGKSDLIYHEGRHLYEHLPKPFQAARYHSLMAEPENLPKHLVIEARNKANMIMGIRHQSLPIYGVQFHPESILTPHGHLLLRAFLERCRHHDFTKLH